jgi:ABC-type sulfate/molybdate transport systems ATPase subunit
MTVAQNIAYGLDARGDAKAAQRVRVAEMLKTVRMEDFGDRKPGQISGGQQQRVALACVLAVRPLILLLDESPSPPSTRTSASTCRSRSSGSNGNSP